MATLKAMVLAHHEKEGGLFNVKICVTHFRLRSYISTKTYVSRKQLTKDLKFKDPKVIKDNADTIFKFHEMISRLGDRIGSMTVKQLADYLNDADNRSKEKSQVIDFLAEGFAHANLQEGLYGNDFRTTLRSFADFVEKDSFDIQELTSNVLYKYEEYLRKPRSGMRNDRYGVLKPVKFIPASDSTLHHYLTNIRTIFNVIRKKYNGEHEDDMRIRHYPFSKYELVAVPETRKRNLKPVLIRLIRDFPDRQYRGTHGTNRVTLAKDIFMLSFYLAGMNTVDLFNIKSYKDGRLNYNRSKTKSRRKDNAFMSIKVQPEALNIINKYRDPDGSHVFVFHKMYADAQAFNKNINKGLKVLLKMLRLDESGNETKLINDELDWSHYYARHSWATIARNICKISKEDVSEALNHASSHDVTDIYIERDWSPIDDANRKVLDVILKDPQSLNVMYEIPDIKT